MNAGFNRRSFLKKSAAAAVAAPLVTSVEEFRLLAAEPVPPAVPGATQTMAMAKIGDVKISRLICGGNLISGYAHSRDLIYVSKLLKTYFSEAKIKETWALCEQNGINTMIFNPSDKRALRIYTDYKKEGGKIQCLAQVDAPKKNMGAFIKEIVDAGVDGILLVGNVGDAWSRDGLTDLFGEFIEQVQTHGIIAGIAGHELRTPMTVEKAGLKPDFYMKTLHGMNYWSKQRPDQAKDVIDNYSIDNYWCKEPESVIDFMKTVKRPWLAYKVLAAGAINPYEGFKHAFQNGADLAVVGMFDFQVAEDVRIANDAIKAAQNRARPWMA